jgi:hypothetical protein
MLGRHDVAEEVNDSAGAEHTGNVCGVFGDGITASPDHVFGSVTVWRKRAATAITMGR